VASTRTALSTSCRSITRGSLVQVTVSHRVHQAVCFRLNVGRILICAAKGGAPSVVRRVVSSFYRAYPANDEQPTRICGDPLRFHKPRTLL
jgi:hypothetical protein